MSLKSFHIVFIAASIGLMTFLGVWSWRMGTSWLLGCSAAGFLAALGYLAWFVRRYRYLT